MIALVADGYTYSEDREIWHDGKGNPKTVAAPSQFPDLGGTYANY